MLFLVTLCLPAWITQCLITELIQVSLAPAEFYARSSGSPQPTGTSTPQSALDLEPSTPSTSQTPSAPSARTSSTVSPHGPTSAVAGTSAQSSRFA